MNRKGMTIAALAAAIGLIALVPGSGSARGPIPLPPCPKKTLCVWQDGYVGEKLKIDGKGISNEIARKLDDEVSSFYNRRNGVAYLYEDKNAKGDRYCIPPKGHTDYIGDFFNDRVSSSKLTSKDGCPI
jgi:hypothetical protein